VTSELVTGLSRFVASTAVSVADVQARLAAAHAARVSAWRQLIVTAQGTPLEGAARAIAPSELVVESCVVKAQISLEHSFTNEFSIRILNAGVVSRYGSNEFFRSKLQVEIRRVPRPLDQSSTALSPL
jgi:hypothetical protein